MLDVFHGESCSFGVSLINASSLTVHQLSTKLTTIPSRFVRNVKLVETVVENTPLTSGEKREISVLISGPSTPCIFESDSVDEDTKISLIEERFVAQMW